MGETFNYHYNRSHLAKIFFVNPGGRTDCNCNPEVMPKDCCKDKLKYAKANDHKIVQSGRLIFPLENFNPNIQFNSNADHFGSQKKRSHS